MIEDSAMNQVLIEALLQDLGLNVQFANDGKMGVDKVMALKNEGRIPSMIFMDMQMPIMDGIEATQQIRKDPELQNVPIVALSADAFSEQQKKAYAVGINDYLLKPIDLVKLKKTLKKYLSHHP